MAASYDEVLSAVVATLEEFEDRDRSVAIGPQTRFFADLGFASIDAIILGEKLEARFGKRLPFAKFLGELAQRGAEDLEVGALVEFLREHA